MRYVNIVQPFYDREFRWIQVSLSPNGINNNNNHVIHQCNLMLRSFVRSKCVCLCVEFGMKRIQTDAPNSSSHRLPNEIGSIIITEYFLYIYILIEEFGAWNFWHFLLNALDFSLLGSCQRYAMDINILFFFQFIIIGWCCSLLGVKTVWRT